MKVMSECQESAELETFVRMIPHEHGRAPDWELGIAVLQRVATSRQQLVAFVHEADKQTWTSAVSSSWCTWLDDCYLQSRFPFAG